MCFSLEAGLEWRRIFLQQIVTGAQGCVSVIELKLFTSEACFQKNVSVVVCFGVIHGSMQDAAIKPGLAKHLSHDPISPLQLALNTNSALCNHTIILPS